VKKSKKKHITFIFPVHNEASILTQQIQRFLYLVQKIRLENFEVILVENGSVDTSAQEAQELTLKYPQTVRLITLPAASYGQAIKAGITAAKGSSIFIFNVDLFSVPFIKQALPLLETIPIVVGSKTLPASNDLRSPLRRISSYLFNTFLRLVLNYPGTDTHGIKALRNSPQLKKAMRLCLTQNELFDTELLIRLSRQGALLVDVPIEVRELRKTRYTFHKRFLSTLHDFKVAFYAKYFVLGRQNNPIVVADDFGISEHVNNAILEQLKKKTVTVVSVLANHITPSAAKKLKRQASLKTISIHFNVTRGIPLSSPQHIPSLVTAQGTFFPTPRFLKRLLFGQINLDEVHYELQLQVSKMKKLGLKPRYCDSEQHIMTFPPLWESMASLAKKERITYLRSKRSTEFYLRRKPIRWLIFTFFQVLLNWKYPEEKTKKVKVYDGLITHPGTEFDRFTFGV
jgi:predicted glycoside hydrolase/deacetylase ChbG (UPF0249 family)